MTLVKFIFALLWLMLIAFPAFSKPNTPIFSEYWCGADRGCRGFSKDFSDIHPKANFVFIAFATVYDSGKPLFRLNVSISEQTFKDNIEALKKQPIPKKVILSVAEGWGGVMKYPDVFAKGIVTLIKQYDMDGVDLDIEGADLANAKQAQKLIAAIHALRAQFNTVTDKHLYITITPEAVTVMNTVHAIKYSRNAMVPVINKAIDDIDFIQIQEYNDYPYLDKPGTAKYLEHIYISWLYPFFMRDPVNNVRLYHGIPASKLVMGVPASPVAAQRQYYIQPKILSGVIEQLQRQYPDFAGVMLWNSYLDRRNNYVISNAIVAGFNNTFIWRSLWPRSSRLFFMR